MLGVICALLVAKLVGQYRAMQPSTKTARVATPATGRRSPKVSTPVRVANDLAEYDPTIHVDKLTELDSRPLPDEERNPFTPVGVAGPSAAARPMNPGEPPPPGAPPEAATNAAPAPPPPPSPPPIKAMGYNEGAGGKGEAMLTFNDDLSVVHEGDTVGGKYKVTKVSPSLVVVEDTQDHQTFEFPIPQ